MERRTFAPLRVGDRVWRRDYGFAVVITDQDRGRVSIKLDSGRRVYAVATNTLRYAERG